MVTEEDEGLNTKESSIRVGLDEDLNLLVTLVKGEDSLLMPTYHKTKPSYLPIVELRKRESPSKVYHPSL